MAEKTLVVDQDGVVLSADEDDEGRELSVEEMEAAQRRRDGWSHVDVAVVAGHGNQATFDIDHRKVSDDGSVFVSTIEAKLPRLYVEGEFNPGDKVRLEVEILVEDIGFPPIKEKGIRIGTERRHKGEVVRVRKPKR